MSRLDRISPEFEDLDLVGFIDPDEEEYDCSDDIKWKELEEKIDAQQAQFEKDCERVFAESLDFFKDDLEFPTYRSLRLNLTDPSLMSTQAPWSGLPDSFSLRLEESFTREPTGKQFDFETERTHLKARMFRERFFVGDHARQRVNSEIEGMLRRFGDNIPLFMILGVARRQPGASKLDSRNRVRANGFLHPTDLDTNFDDYINQPGSVIGTREGSIANNKDHLVLNFSLKNPIFIPQDRLCMGLYFEQGRCKDGQHQISFALPQFFKAVEEALDQNEAFDSPLEWANSRIKSSLGVCWQLWADDFDFRQLEYAYTEMAKRVGNLSPAQLAQPVRVDLNTRNESWCEKVQSQLGDLCTAELLYLFTRSSLRPVFQKAFRDNALWFYNFVEDFNVALSNGLNILDFVEQIFLVKKEVGNIEKAIRTTIKLMSRVYSEGEAPWWFKHRCDLVQADLGLPLETLTSIAEKSHFAYEDTAKVYAEVGMGLCTALGGDESLAVDFVSRVVAKFGVGNPDRAKKLIVQATEIVKETQDEKVEYLEKFFGLIDRNKPNNEMLGLLEDKKTIVELPGQQNLIALSGKIDADTILFSSVDDAMIAEHVPHYLAKSRKERRPASIQTRDGRVQDISDRLALPSLTHLRLSDPEEVLDSSVPASLENPRLAFVDFYEKFYRECESMQRFRSSYANVASFYFSCCAGFFEDPLNPPDGFIRYLHIFLNIQNPAISYEWLFETPGSEERRDVHRQNTESYLNRSMVMHNLLGFFADGLLTWEQVEDWLSWMLEGFSGEEYEKTKKKLTDEAIVLEASRFFRDIWQLSAIDLDLIPHACFWTEVWGRYVADRNQKGDPLMIDLDTAKTSEDHYFYEGYSDHPIRKIVSRVNAQLFDLQEQSQNQNLAKTMFSIGLIRVVDILLKSGAITDNISGLIIARVLSEVKEITDFDPKNFSQIFRSGDLNVSTLDKAFRLDIFDTEKLLKDLSSLDKNSELTVASIIELLHTDLTNIIKLHTAMRELSDTGSKHNDPDVNVDLMSFKTIWAEGRYLKVEGFSDFFRSFGWPLEYGDVWQAAMKIPLAKDTENPGGYAEMATRASLLSGFLLAARHPNSSDLPLLMSPNSRGEIGTALTNVELLEDFFPVFREYILMQRKKYFGMMPLAGKVHLHGTFTEDLFRRLRRFLGLSQTSFKLIHAGESLCLPPMPTSAEITLFARLLQEEGLISADSPEIQLCGSVRIPNRDCGITGSMMLLSTDVTARFNAKSFDTSDHNDLTGARMMAYDAPGYNEIQAPFVPEGGKGRTDVLGRMHIDDAHRYWIFHNILAQEITGKPMGVLASSLRSEYEGLLRDYSLGAVLDAPWVFLSEIEKFRENDPRHFEEAVKPCQDAYYAAFEAFGNGKSCIISDIRDVVDKYDEKVQELSQGLWNDGTYAKERAALTTI